MIGAKSSLVQLRSAFNELLHITSARQAPPYPAFPAIDAVNARLKPSHESAAYKTAMQNRVDADALVIEEVVCAASSSSGSDSDSSGVG